VRLKRRTIRLRLTLLYSGLFLLAGAALLGTAYGLVASNLNATQAAAVSAAVSGKQLQPSPWCRPGNIPAAEQMKCKQDEQKAIEQAAKATAAQERHDALNRLLYNSLGSLGLMAMISAMLGWIVAGRALRPVHAITAAARRASEANLGERIALTGPDDELKELADTFDAMLSRLDAAFASQRRFVANASHELRTPLTVMRTSVDVTLAKPDRTQAQLEAMAAEVRQGAERAELLIEALLTLARSDRGTRIRVPLDLAVLAEDAAETSTSAIRSGRLSVRTSLRSAPFLGDPVLAERLVTNLVDNAVRHNAPDGWIELRTGTRDDMAFIAVANGGAAIPDESVPSLFEPFWRGTERAGSPAGAGLGLSIVRSVAIAHNGQISAANPAAGGLEVSVLFPAAG
jgi:signal transduction histidine kinase